MPRCKGMLKLFVVPALCAGLFSGCESMNNTERGALGGGALGAGLGTFIGHQSGHKETGALVGGALGALGGAAVGKAKDNAEERDVYRDYAAHQAASREAEARAITNYDIVAMTQNRMSDTTIMKQIQSKGGRFDTSTQGIIRLQEQGVSERVINYMQDATAGQ